MTEEEIEWDKEFYQNDDEMCAGCGLFWRDCEGSCVKEDDD